MTSLSTLIKLVQGKIQKKFKKTRLTSDAAKVTLKPFHSSATHNTFHKGFKTKHGEVFDKPRMTT